MKYIKSFLGYSIAVVCILISIMVGPMIGLLAEPFIKTTGLRLSPNYDGGEVRQTIDHAAYQTLVHRMVFDNTLIGERKEGFVQVEWAPLAALPAHIDEEVDVNGDNQADFRLVVDTANKQSVLTPYSSWVQELEGTYRFKNSMAVRVRLKNPAR